MRASFNVGDAMPPENQFTRELEELRNAKFRSGESEYGNMRYQQNTVLGLSEEVKDEIVDAMNWLELLYYKIRFLEEAIRAGSLHRPDEVSPPILPDRISPGPSTPGAE
jgi:hypothetical protein